MVVVKIVDWMKEEALDYASKSNDYTSRRHDFHEGVQMKPQDTCIMGNLEKRRLKRYYEIAR